MTKSIVISERDNIAAVVENDKVSEFFVTKGDILFFCNISKLNTFCHYFTPQLNELMWTENLPTVSL